MPERPCVNNRCDNYKMENAHISLSSISILVSHEASLGWYVLTMPEPMSCLCVEGQVGGYPKIVRKVTLEVLKTGMSVPPTKKMEDAGIR